MDRQNSDLNIALQLLKRDKNRLPRCVMLAVLISPRQSMLYCGQYQLPVGAFYAAYQHTL